jgi:hypothetical protein
MEGEERGILLKISKSAESTEERQEREEES